VESGDHRFAAKMHQNASNSISNLNKFSRTPIHYRRLWPRPRGREGSEKKRIGRKRKEAYSTTKTVCSLSLKDWYKAKPGTILV